MSDNLQLKSENKQQSDIMNELSLNQDHSIEDSFSHNFQGPEGASSLNSHRGFNRVMVLDRDILKGINQEMEFD